MKKFNVNKREVLFFFLGVIIVIIIETLINWQECKKDFLKGWNDAKIEESK
ncbi:MAG: hypothetical protein PWR03_1807 [Tenuifilum sp.]|jgi:endo-1,4-beta-D-glucanase Y|nr:hypothetical protein [Tenuifilum sp.]